LDAGGGDVDDLWWWVRWLLVERSVWSVAVVVGGVLGQDARQVSSAGDEDPVGALASDGADPAFRVGVCPWCLWWCAEYVDAGGGEDRVERGGELRVSVSQQEAQPVVWGS
jgi:hypothetical protein